MSRSTSNRRSNSRVQSDETTLQVGQPAPDAIAADLNRTPEGAGEDQMPEVSDAPSARTEPTPVEVAAGMQELADANAADETAVESAAEQNLSERYSRACAEVTRTHKLFIAALDEKARYFGVQRVGEAVPANIPEMDALDAEIKETREKLEKLVAKRREIKTADPLLQAIQQRISEARQARNLARAEKMVAYHEATAK